MLTLDPSVASTDCTISDIIRAQFQQNVTIELTFHDVFKTMVGWVVRYYPDSQSIEWRIRCQPIAPLFEDSRSAMFAEVPENFYFASIDDVAKYIPQYIQARLLDGPEVIFADVFGQLVDKISHSAQNVAISIIRLAGVGGTHRIPCLRIEIGCCVNERTSDAMRHARHVLENDMIARGFTFTG